MVYRRKHFWLLAFLLTLPLVSAPTKAGVDESDLLKYTLTVKPGDLTVDRIPSPTPKSYKETFSFLVNNPRKSDYKGSAPTCQTFDVEVFLEGSGSEISVWKWSAGMYFCQSVTPVQIPADESWRQTVVWEFTTSQISDGKYRAVATFVPSGNKTASVNFQITSVNDLDKTNKTNHSQVVSASTDANGHQHIGVAPIRSNGKITCISAHGHDELHYPPACYVVTTSSGSQILKPNQSMGTGSGGTMNLVCNGQAPMTCSARIDD
jgi:Intracellular proteinase inhibitor